MCKIQIAMKKFYYGVVLLCLLFNLDLAAQRFSPLDKNPTDIAYLRTNKLTQPLVKVVYSRPTKEAEAVFGEQVPFEKIWRTGDNEATELKFYSDVKFGDKLVKAGTYVLHTIPGEKEWTIILNSNTDTWGAFFYDETKDVARIKVPVKEAESIDIFTIVFNQNYNNTFMVLAWDSTRVNIPLETYSQFLAEL